MLALVLVLAAFLAASLLVLALRERRFVDYRARYTATPPR